MTNYWKRSTPIVAVYATHLGAILDPFSDKWSRECCSCDLSETTLLCWFQQTTENNSKNWKLWCGRIAMKSVHYDCFKHSFCSRSLCRRKKLVICERQKCIFSIFRDEAIIPWSVLWLCFMICFHWIWRLQYSWAPVVHRHPTVLPEQIPALFFFSSVLLGSSSFYWKWEEAKNSNTRGCLYSFWIIYELFQNLMKSYRRYYPWRKTLWITSKISYIQQFLSSIFQLIKICSVCFLFVFCFSMQSQLWQVTPCCNEEDTLAVTMGSEAWECARTLGLSGGVWH